MAARKLGECEKAINALWKRAKDAGVDLAQWGAAYAGAKEAAKAMDGEVDGASALASLVNSFRLYETELRNEIARLKAVEEEKVSENVRLIDKVNEREHKRKGYKDVEGNT